ncbi:MAG: MFS transporter [Reyranella sp.]|uniref:MFS transporter n=1 Tax=Reyranella sp. TaxID=1929291 RepID=UPI0012111B71|nr:MFS transporter [Reyranella sp.]TAJ40395.1 MAG: MFS transporter [Reyranella sp.]
MTAVVHRPGHGPGVDSPYAWRLAFLSMFCIGLGGGAIYLPVIALKEIAAEFGDRRAVPSFAYMVGFFFMGVGGVFMGWLADRTSPRVPLLIAGVSILAGGWLASSGGELALYVGYAIPFGFLGNAATFTPAMNNIQGWFDRRRSTAVSIISVGPALSGFVWPQIYRWLLPEVGWREMLMIYGVTAGVLLFVCAFYVRPSPVARSKAARPVEDLSSLPMSSPALMVLLSAAGFCCCTAMAVPFVHMVAFCGDLGFSPARGSEAISLILLTAVAATFAMGRLSDYIGPIKVSLLCAVIQIASLAGFVFVEGLSGIYTLSIIHGIPYIAIVQGYALILRYLYGPTIAGWRLGVVMLFAMAGMAVGGWLGGALFDATLSYRSAFQAALAFNLLNLMLLGALYMAQRRRRGFLSPP